MSSGIDDGPVLVVVEYDRIVGAIGPLGTMTDATGASSRVYPANSASDLPMVAPGCTRQSGDGDEDAGQWLSGLIWWAAPAGFEPAAHGLGNRCSIP
jgi:hypothetical protein